MYSGVYGILLIIAALLLCGIFILVLLPYRDFNIAFSKNMILLQPGINNISLYRYCLPVIWKAVSLYMRSQSFLTPYFTLYSL